MCQNFSNKMVSGPFDKLSFPKFESEYNFEQRILIVWFERQFSQTFYTPRNCSNACTLIAILMAAKCHHTKLKINQPQKSLNTELIYMLDKSMRQGNHIHEQLRQNNVLKHVNLSVPEAIKFGEGETQGMVEWKSPVYTQSMSKYLYEHLKSSHKLWMKMSKNKRPDYLFVVLVADSRSVLFVFQEQTDTITLIDSHQHSQTNGAIIAVCRTNRMRSLCEWFTQMTIMFYKCDPHLYELSFLYFEKEVIQEN